MQKQTEIHRHIESIQNSERMENFKKAKNIQTSQIVKASIKDLKTHNILCGINPFYDEN